MFGCQSFVTSWWNKKSWSIKSNTVWTYLTNEIQWYQSNTVNESDVEHNNSFIVHLLTLLER
jgi:hypothetical protein